MQRILVVEGDREVCAAMCRTLSGDANVVVEAMSTFKEAVAALEAHVPTLIIADPELPDGSGLDLLPELALRDHHLPVIFATDDVARYRDQLPEGAQVDLLSKPIDHTELELLVKQRLGGDPGVEVSGGAFSVADYLQLAGMARRSVELTVRDHNGTAGRIVIQGGRTVWAKDNQGEGLDAFSRLALMAHADVQCRPSEHAPGPPNLSGSVDELLLEAARRVDEQRFQHGRPEPRLRDTSSGRAGAAAHRPALVAPPPAPGPRSASAGLSVERALSPAVARVPAAGANIEVMQQVAVGDPEPTLRGPSAAADRRDARSPSVRNVAARPVAVTAPAGKELLVEPSKAVTAADVLALAPSLHAAARASGDGSVLELAGDMDAETTCAVAAFAARHVEEVAAELGLGELSAWHITMGESAWYVINDGADLVVAAGESSKNPGSVLQKISNGCRS